MVYILLGTGFEEIEAFSPCDLLRRAGVDVRLVGLSGRAIVGSHKICVEADLTIEEAIHELPELLVLPGGLGGVRSILGCDAALELTKRCWNEGRLVAAICAAPTILAALGITDGKQATCYPGMEDKMGTAQMQPVSVVTDGRLITGRAAGSAMDFALCLVERMAGRAEADRIRNGVVYRPQEALYG